MVLAGLYDYGPNLLETIIGLAIIIGIAAWLRRDSCQRVCEGSRCWRICPDNPPADPYIGYREHDN